VSSPDLLEDNATSNYLRAIAFATFMTIALATKRASLNPFSESAFCNGNTSLGIFPRALPFAYLTLRQLQCDVPGDNMIPDLFHPMYLLATNYFQLVAQKNSILAFQTGTV
jgi:hypothetical protein